MRHTRRSLYRYVFKIDPEFFGVRHDVFCQALSAEGIPVDTGYPVMSRYDLFQPLSLPPGCVPSAFPEYFQFDQMSFPVTEQAAEATSGLDGRIDLPRRPVKGIDDLVAGVQKTGGTSG